LGLKEKITKEEEDKREREEKTITKNKIRKEKYVWECRKKQRAMTKWELFLNNKTSSN
jgi:hypothetical protein